MGMSERDSVVDIYLKVWGYDNFYFGICGVIFIGIVCNIIFMGMVIVRKVCEGIFNNKIRIIVSVIEWDCMNLVKIFNFF